LRRHFVARVLGKVDPDPYSWVQVGWGDFEVDPVQRGRVYAFITGECFVHYFDSLPLNNTPQWIVAETWYTTANAWYLLVNFQSVWYWLPHHYDLNPNPIYE